MAIDADNDGGAPGTNPVRFVLAGLLLARTAARLIFLPNFFAVLFIDRDEKSPLPWPEIKNTKVLMQNGRSRIAPDVRLFAEIPAPYLFAFKIIAIEPGRAERGDDPHSVGDRRSRALWIAVMGYFFFRINDAGLPKLFATLPIEAKEHAAVFLFQRLGDEHAIAPNNRTRVAPV